MTTFSKKKIYENDKIDEGQILFNFDHNYIFQYKYDHLSAQFNLRIIFHNFL